jgi:hypothetical protein
MHTHIQYPPTHCVLTHGSTYKQIAVHIYSSLGLGIIDVEMWIRILYIWTWIRIQHF